MPIITTIQGCLVRQEDLDTVAVDLSVQIEVYKYTGAFEQVSLE